MIRLGYMNETNLTARQKFILNLINQAEGLLRDEIKTKIAEIYPISKPTLIRDLNSLAKGGLIRVHGQAKATKYFPVATNPLLRKFDLDRYFADDPDKRLGAKKSFDFGIFDHLRDLFLPDELAGLEELSHSYSQKTKQLSPDILKRELERFVIELSWKSAKIEGSTYTLLETEALVKEQKEAAGKQKSEAVMILNHKKAFEEILRDVRRFGELDLSDVNQLHNLLVAGLGIGTGIRRQAVGITGTVYRPLDNEFQIREVFERTFEMVNKTRNPFEKALIVHFMFPYIQPYADGNKRTARMLTNAMLLAHDLYPLSYRSADEDEFKKALILFYEQESIWHIKRLFIEQVKFANENYFV